MEYVELIVAICGAISVIVPLGINLYSALKALVKEKNYAKILKIMKDAACEAEKLYTDKSDKRDYVLNILKVTCANLKVEYDEQRLDEELTEFINATKLINVK